MKKLGQKKSKAKTLQGSRRSNRNRNCWEVRKDLGNPEHRKGISNNNNNNNFEKAVTSTDVAGASGKRTTDRGRTPRRTPRQPLESLGTLNLGGLRFAAFAFETVWWWWTITYCLTAGRSRPPRLLHLVLFACKERDRNCDNRPPNNAHSIAFVAASVECFQPYWTSSYTTLS